MSLRSSDSTALAAVLFGAMGSLALYASPEPEPVRVVRAVTVEAPPRPHIGITLTVTSEDPNDEVRFTLEQDDEGTTTFHRTPTVLRLDPADGRAVVEAIRADQRLRVDVRFRAREMPYPIASSYRGARIWVEHVERNLIVGTRSGPR